MRITKFFKEFFSNSQSSGVLLVLCVTISLMIANSSAATGFQAILDKMIGPYSVSMWINDGLMAVFFLLVGLEIKRELLKGELSNFKNASLPIFAAIGGMIVPAIIFTIFKDNAIIFRQKYTHKFLKFILINLNICSYHLFYNSYKIKCQYNYSKNDPIVSKYLEIMLFNVAHKDFNNGIGKYK